MLNKNFGEHQILEFPDVYLRAGRPFLHGHEPKYGPLPCP
jgi:hypothetical protein